MMTRFESLVSPGYAAEALGVVRVYIAMERRVGGEPDAITDYPATIREISAIVQTEMVTTIQTAVWDNGPSSPTVNNSSGLDGTQVLGERSRHEYEALW